MTKFADTSSGPSFSRRSISAPNSGTYSQSVGVVGAEEGGAHVALGRRLPGVARGTRRGSG